jgi:hypothetical protein
VLEERTDILRSAVFCEDKNVPSYRRAGRYLGFPESPISRALPQKHPLPTYEYIGWATCGLWFLRGKEGLALQLDNRLMLGVVLLAEPFSTTIAEQNRFHP